MQAKRAIYLFFAFTLTVNVFKTSFDSESAIALSDAQLRNKIETISALQAFNVHINISKYLEKNKESSNNNINLKNIDDLLIEKIDTLISDKKEKKISEAISKSEINKNIKILRTELAEKKTYNSANRMLYGYNVSYISNGIEKNTFVSLYFNGDIGAYLRPQERKNSSLIEKEININLEDKIISGTISGIQGNKGKGLIIITNGAGENDRDYFINRHRIGISTTNFLTSLGYTVFRYDKSGVGKSSGPTYSSTTTEESEKNLDGIIDYFKENKEYQNLKIGLLGYSEGSVISSMAASQRNDIAFLILAGAPYSSLKDMILDGGIESGIGTIPLSLKSKVHEVMSDLVKIVSTKGSELSRSNSITKYYNSLTIEKRLIFKKIEESIRFGSENDLKSNWLNGFINLDIKSYLTNIKVPILIINGENDFIIDSTKLSGIFSIIKAKNPLSDGIILAKTGHLLESSESRTNEDYSNLNESLNPTGLTVAKKWLESISS